MQEANYPITHQERFLRDFLVFGINSSRVRKECLKEGNNLTLQKAKYLEKAEESAEKQLKSMNRTEVNTVKKHKKSNKRNASKSFDKIYSSSNSHQKAWLGC